MKKVSKTIEVCDTLPVGDRMLMKQTCSLEDFVGRLQFGIDDMRLLSLPEEEKMALDITEKQTETPSPSILEAYDLDPEWFSKAAIYRLATIDQTHDRSVSERLETVALSLPSVSILSYYHYKKLKEASK